MESDLLRIRFAGIVGQTPVAHKISRGMTARALARICGSRSYGRGLYRARHVAQTGHRPCGDG